MEKEICGREKRQVNGEEIKGGARKNRGWAKMKFQF